MLKKLLKYDMKWCLKVVSIYIIIGLVLAVLGRLIDLFPESVFLFIEILSISVTGCQDVCL